jgi:hypothetical protein
VNDDIYAQTTVLRHEVRELRTDVAGLAAKTDRLYLINQQIESDLWNMILFVRAFVYAVVGLIIAGGLYLYFN